MELREIQWHLNGLIECIDFDHPKDRSHSEAPCGDKYVERKFFAAKSLFDDPEDVLCRLFLSQLILDIRAVEFWAEHTNGSRFDGYIKLYWRTKPEIEDDGKGFVKFFTRYLVVGEKGK